MSNETRWTPGPWGIDHIGDDIYEVGSGSDGVRVARVEGEANARLIAAAPEMATLLEDLAAHPNNVAWRGDEIRALLAKIKKGA